MSMSKLNECKIAIRRLSAEDRTQLIVWLAHGMPKDEVAEDVEEESSVDAKEKADIWKKV